VAKDDVDRLARMFRALSNPNRLRLFMNLLEESKLDLAKGRIHDCFLAKLLGGLELGAPTVSHHVKELADAGLIHTQREGKQLICSVDPEGLGASATAADLFAIGMAAFRSGNRPAGNDALQRALPWRPEIDHRLWNGPLEIHLLRY